MQIAIYGSGGFARELRWLAETPAWDVSAPRVTCFIDDDPARIGQSVADLPVRSFEDFIASAPDSRIVLGIGSPQVRQKLAAKIAQSSLRFVSLIHPNVLMSHSVQVGEAAVICAGNILTSDIVLGAHVQINLACTVGHDVVMEDFVTLAPGVHVSGNVILRQAAYIGTGAVIINGTPTQQIEIGAGAVVGAGACVTKSVPAGTTVGGVPAKPLHKA